MSIGYLFDVKSIILSTMLAELNGFELLYNHLPFRIEMRCTHGHN